MSLPARIQARADRLSARLRPRSAARLREANETMVRILGAIDEYLYTGEFLPDGGYRLLLKGPCRAQFLALPPDEADRAVWAEYVHPDDRERFDAIHESLVSAGSLDFQYRLIDATGATRWVRDRGRIRREGGRHFLDGSVMDVTEMHHIHAELEAARAEADRLARIDPLTELPNRRSLDAIMERSRAAGGYGLLLVDVDRFKRVNDAHGHAVGDQVLVEVGRRLAAAAGGPDSVVRMGGEEFMVALTGLADEHALRVRAETFRDMVGSRHLDVSAGPLTITVSIGAVLATSADVDPDALLASADHALYAAKRLGRDCVRLDTDLSPDEVAGEDSEALRIALALARCVTARERGSDRHAAEVADLGARVARRMRCSPAEVSLTRLGGFAHDIGKLSIPDAVLLKAGPLDHDEWKVMQTHPEAGERVVRDLPELAHLAPVVRHHHERWDGTGYPDRLAGEAIPLAARIVAAVDAYSAMTTDRVYRGAIGAPAALAELRRVSATQLDPLVVEALCDELDPVAWGALRLPAAATPASG
ncbi:MAG: hypothetical protein QOJ07_2655 [Thermoleophilaceae bacterium]|nr:hypothetical protein [Thermoleophilaceae bacterium]